MRNRQCKYIGLLIVLFFRGIGGWGQVQVLPISPSPEKLASLQFWQVQIQYQGSDLRQVILRTEIHDAQGKPLYWQESEPFPLQPGSQSPARSGLRIARSEYPSPDLAARMAGRNALPPGRYEWCTILLPATGDIPLGRHCQLVDVAAPEAVESTPRPWEFSGRGRVEYTYADRQWYGSRLPPQFVRIDLHPEVAWQGIPLGLDVFWTNETRLVGTSMNAVSLRFDAPQFRRRLTRLLEEKLQERRERLLDRYGPDLQREKAILERMQGLETLDTSALSGQIRMLRHRLDSLQDPWLDRKIALLQERLADARSREKQWQDSLLSWQQSRNEKLHLEREKLEGNLAAYQKDLITLDSLQNLREQLISWEQSFRQLQQQQKQFRQLLRGQNYRQNLLTNLQQQNDSLQNRLIPQDIPGDPHQLRSRLQQEGLLSAGDRRLLLVQELALGAHYPDMSPLFLRGAQVDGLIIGLEPLNGLQFHFSGGNLRLPRFPLGPAELSGLSPGRVFSGKLSWRASNDRRFYLSGRFLPENEHGTEPTLLNPLTTNWILGAGGTWAAADGRWKSALDLAFHLDAAATSNRPSDRAAAQFYVWADLWQDHLQLEFDWQQTGRDYLDESSPFLLAGMVRQDARISSRWWNDQLIVSLFYQRDQNRPLGFSPFTMESRQWGVQAQLQAASWPTLQLQLARNLLEQEMGSGNSILLNLHARHHYPLGQLTATSSLQVVNTRQQWDPLTPPAWYEYWEFSQQIQLNQAWTTRLSYYRAYEQLSGRIPDVTYQTAQAYAGIDWQQQFALKSAWQFSFLAGAYRLAHADHLQWRGQFQSNLQLNRSVQIQAALAWGQLPALSTQRQQSYGTIGLAVKH